VLAGYILFFNRKERTAFFYDQKVFDQFEGKLDLEAKLKSQAEADRKLLDSMASLMQSGRQDLNATYQQNLRQSSQNYQQLSEKYTSDIWKHINGEVANFGREKGYDYIFGASGNGSLMYADSLNDITGDVIKYLNEKYK